MSLPRFLVSTEALLGSRAVLTGAVLQHMRAHRLRAGSRLVLVDGIGTQRQGTVASLDRYQAVIALGEAEAQQRESRLRLVLAQALLKGDKLDWVIEKATELGVHELIVFTSEHTVGRPGSERHVRWHRVARSAAQQSQRSALPRIVGPLTMDAVFGRGADALRLFFFEHQARGGLAGVAARSPAVPSVLAVVGPEGGFSSAEVESATRAGFEIVGLTPRILRAETAALVAVTLCQYLWGDLGTQPA